MTAPDPRADLATLRQAIADARARPSLPGVPPHPADVVRAAAIAAALHYAQASLGPLGTIEPGAVWAAATERLSAALDALGVEGAQGLPDAATARGELVGVAIDGARAQMAAAGRRDWRAELDAQDIAEALAQGEPEPYRRRAVLVRIADVAPEPVSWLWYPYIPRGKLTLLEGDPAAGKTWLALAIAAALSRGAGLPDASGRPGEKRAAESVIYLTAEDGLADTLRVRLDALEADCSRIHVLTGVQDGDAELPATLRDVDALDDGLKRTAAGLLVVDPMQGFLGANVDMHRANEVRPVLAGLARLAERRGCAVLCIRHLAKAHADRSLYRGLGSIDFTAAARSVLLAGRDPTDPTRRAVVQHKNSLAPEGPALAYSIEGGRFGWAGLSTLTAASLLAADTGDSDRSARDEARDFLVTVLADGPAGAKAVQKQAREAGIAERTLYRAKAELRVKSCRAGNGWAWSLPSGSTLPTVPSTECDNLGNLDLDEGVIP